VVRNNGFSRFGQFNRFNRFSIHTEPTQPTEPTKLTKPILVFLLLGLAASAHAAPIDHSMLTSDRWFEGYLTPGRNGIGGIPTNRTQCGPTILASTYGNGANDAEPAISAAIAACGPNQYVLLGPGTFRANDSIQVSKSDVTLRGSGRCYDRRSGRDCTGATIIDNIGRGTYFGLVHVGNDTYDNGYPNTTNLTANAVQGAYSVTVANAGGLSVGQIVLLDMLRDTTISFYATDCDANCKAWFSRSGRPAAEYKKITAINGTTVTFEEPFALTYKTSLTAQLAWPSTPFALNVGVENLTVQYGICGDCGGNIVINECAYCWVKNVESYKSLGASVHVYASYHNVVRDSDFHHSYEAPEPGGGAYGIDVAKGATGNLIENNITRSFNKTMLTRAGGPGNVFGYNYSEDGYGNSYKEQGETGLNYSHMTTPHHALFEGNRSWGCCSEARWGNSLYVTFLRNQMTSYRADLEAVGLSETNSARGMGEISCHHMGYSFIGNVLGDTAARFTGSSPFTYEDTYPFADSPLAAWRFGRGDALGAPECQNAPDPLSKSTTFRDATYWYGDNTVHWDSSAPNSYTVPDSFYLTSKPAFFGNCQWPWVDPTGTTKLYTLPAKARFEGTPCDTSVPPSTGSACDIDGNNSTNVSDVQLCANQAIGVTICGAGDINLDTSCNVMDVQRVVNAALGGQCVSN
jgi:hypothetical protein